MRVVCLNDDFTKTIEGTDQRNSLFKMLQTIGILPKFGHDYEVNKIINYEYGIVGYVLEECNCCFVDGMQVTFLSDRFLILSEKEEFTQ